MVVLNVRTHSIGIKMINTVVKKHVYLVKKLNVILVLKVLL